jgi:hypothetical protein
MPDRLAGQAVGRGVPACRDPLATGEVPTGLPVGWPIGNGFAIIYSTIHSLFIADIRQ